MCRLKCSVLILNVLVFVQGLYPPLGDDVQPGSVLLPATRRGRYLANIVRRQAVDGTGIKFNKDADRMNAEAKKKVDVLSEELLPYIIAEQERRTTLYKRVMTAIQNGEKGVTIAEIRNKPPLIIKKGLMYRCPSNRAPKEPDGSGIIMCETDIEPTPVMYDSCLSAEDKDLYVAESKYFFCNRHTVEGPDLPRTNGSTVIGCDPRERTSLNYTTGKCALEDTDDVVVHYRYYPDKTYRFVTEFDPDHEVCDHWNPCQIGYIYSLPSPDQATPANELWSSYEEKPEDYEKLVPSIPEDDPSEYIPLGKREKYDISRRKIDVPEGFKFHGIGRLSLANQKTRVTVADKVLTNIKVAIDPPQHAEKRRSSSRRNTLKRGRRFRNKNKAAKWQRSGRKSKKTTKKRQGRRNKGGKKRISGRREGEEDDTTDAAADDATETPADGGSTVEDGDATTADGEATSEGDAEGETTTADGEGDATTDGTTEATVEGHTKNIKIELSFTPIREEDITTYYARFESETQPNQFKYKTIVILHQSSVQTKEVKLDILPGTVVNTTKIPIKCGKCTVRSIMIRTVDGGIVNLDGSKFKVRTETDTGRRHIVFELGKTTFADFGDYFAIIQNEDGNEERVKILCLQSSGADLQVSRASLTGTVGAHVDSTVKYDCDDCVCTDVLCNGESVLSTGRVSIVQATKLISFNFPSFENDNACVYIGIFKNNADDKSYKKVLLILENDSASLTKVSQSAPQDGTQQEFKVPYKCDGDCSVDKVTLNGVPLEMSSRRSTSLAPGVAFYLYTMSEIIIRVTSFSRLFCGLYQAVFNTAVGPVTKTVLDVTDPDDDFVEAPGGGETTTEAGADEVSAGDDTETTAAAEEGEATGESASPGDENAGEESTAATEGEETAAEDQGRRKAGDVDVTTISANIGTSVSGAESTTE